MRLTRIGARVGRWLRGPRQRGDPLPRVPHNHAAVTLSCMVMYTTSYSIINNRTIILLLLFSEREDVLAAEELVQGSALRPLRIILKSTKQPGHTGHFA